jgi:hypothetical protein
MLISFLKSVAIKATDVVNRAYDPFDEFRRPEERRTQDTLKQKAEAFEADLVANFRLPNGVWTYHRYADGHVDTGDQALWHGIITAMFAFKYAVTKAPGDLQLLGDSLAAASNHQRGTPPRLIRGVDGEKFQDDASNDSLTGHFAGIYFAWKYGDTNVRALAARLGGNIAADITSQGDWSIHKQDGTPTSFGKLIDGVLTDPLRLTLCLAILKWAAQAVSPAYESAYEKLWRKYGTMVCYPKVKLFWWEKKYDSHRAAIHLSILADLERYENWKATYVDGLRRVWRIERKSGNAWIAFLVERHAQIPYGDLQASLKWLREFEVNERGPVVERINSVDEVYWNARGVKFFLWPPKPFKDGKLRASQPLPPWRLGSQDFFPQRDLFSVDNWIGEKSPWSWHSGADFLACFWLGRLLKVIGEAD